MSYTPTFWTDLHLLQKKRALETIASVTSNLLAVHNLYDDDSLQTDGSTDCAVFSFTEEPPQGGRGNHVGKTR